MTINIATNDLTALATQVSTLTSEQSTVGVQISGNGAGFTLVPEGSMDGGATWVTVDVYVSGSGASTTPVSTITGNGRWEISPGGYNVFRLRNSVAASSGVVTALLNNTKSARNSAASAGGGGGGAVTMVDGGSVTIGLKNDTASTWYNSTGSLIAKIGLLIAVTANLGSHAYGYTGTNMTTDAWTLFGVTRTKTYTWVNNQLTAESDWV